MLVHVSGAREDMFLPPALHIVAEWDGVRLISQGFHDLIHEVLHHITRPRVT